DVEHGALLSRWGLRYARSLQQAIDPADRFQAAAHDDERVWCGLDERFGGQRGEAAIDAQLLAGVRTAEPLDEAPSPGFRPGDHRHTGAAPVENHHSAPIRPGFPGRRGPVELFVDLLCDLLRGLL